MTDSSGKTKGMRGPGFLEKGELRNYDGGENAALWTAAWIMATLILSFFLFGAALRSGSTPLAVTAGVLTFVWVGWCQTALSNCFHEASHRNFGARHQEVLSRVCLAFPVFFSSGYRALHARHHRLAGDPTDDPDWAGYCPFPTTRFALVQRVLWPGLGVSAMTQLLSRNLRPATANEEYPEERAPGIDLVGIVVVQAVILTLFWITIGPLYYILLWVLPLGTVCKLLKSNRSFCEHGSPDRPYVMRTLTGGPLQTGTMGMFGLNYHAEHHIYPAVPFANLPALHRRHLEEVAGNPEYRAEVESLFVTFEGGYLRLLAHWFHELPWRRPAAQTA